MSITGTLFFDEVCNRGSIRDNDVKELRRLYYEDGEITASEADAIFEINDACRVQDPAWQDFFIEAICDYMINCAEPHGYVTAENADWLIARITHDGVLETHSELEILIRVIDKARWAPESLVRFALNTVKDAVISGSGFLRSGAQLQAGTVTDDDVELIRRIIYAFGGEGCVAVTRAEAEILFEINDLTHQTTDSPAWTELFVKAISSVVMQASGYCPPAREEALRREQWLESRGDLSPVKFAREMFRGGFAGFQGLFPDQTPEERELEALERKRREIVTNEEVTGDEATWLAAQINRDGELTYNERCLLAHLKDVSPRLHPSLETLLDRAPATA